MHVTCLGQLMVLDFVIVTNYGTPVTVYNFLRMTITIFTVHTNTSLDAFFVITSVCR